MPGKLSIFDATTRGSLFVSSHALRTPKYAVSFGLFVRAAQRYVADDPLFDVTVGDWIDGLRIDRTFKNDVLLPWLASLTCYSVDMVKTQSALAFLLLFVHIFPRNVLRRPKTYCSSIGLGGILAMMVDRCRHLAVRAGAPVSKAEEVDGSWFLETSSGRHGPYAKVVVERSAAREPFVPAHAACRAARRPARVTRTTRLGWSSTEIRSTCRRTGATGARTTPPSTETRAKHRSGWEPSAGTRGPEQPVQLFKSWASNRQVEPAAVLAEQTFLHPALTPDTLRATQELVRWQGFNGLHFTGHFTTLTDLQETALYSGMSVARTLSPTSRSLQSLEQRLVSTGHADVSYVVGDGREVR